MDVSTFRRLAEGVLEARGQPLRPNDPERTWLYEDSRIAIRGTYPHYQMATLEVFRIPFSDGSLRNLVAAFDPGERRFEDEHRLIESHLLDLAREIELPFTGIVDKVDALKALAADLADLDQGNREIDAALWWIFADHTETDPEVLRAVAGSGAAAYLDRVYGAPVWREPIAGLVPHLSTSFDALRHWTRTHLESWGRTTEEPDTYRDGDGPFAVTMWCGAHRTDRITAPLLELAAFRAAVQALIARESGLVAEDQP